MINALTKKRSQEYRSSDIATRDESRYSFNLYLWKLNFPLHRLAGLFTFTIYSGKEEKKKKFPSQSFNEFNAGNSTPATVDTRFFIVYDRFCAVEWMGPPMNALSASRDVLQRTLRILTQMTRGRGAYKRAAQVSSLLEAVFNRSPWNYAAYNAYTVSANFEAFLPLLPPSRRRRFVKTQQISIILPFSLDGKNFSSSDEQCPSVFKRRVSVRAPWGRKWPFAAILFRGFLRIFVSRGFFFLLFLNNLG